MREEREKKSVIVKGMGMPKDCYDCPLHDGETGRCNILRIIVFDYIPKECPLVEVGRCEDCKYAEFVDDRIMCEHSTIWLDPDGYCYKYKGEEE